MNLSRELVLASNNRGKQREIEQLLAPYQLQIVTQASLGVTEVEETGLSFVENALIKARHAAHHTGLPALADDSGLEVAALAGAPGIHSARYAGNDADDQSNCAHLLAAMEALAWEQRQARFHCVLVLLRHALDPTPLICCGSWAGYILSQPQGSGGFGYDPLFWVPTHQCSAAELDAATKNQLSHRAQALQCLVAQLQIEMQ